MKKTYVILLMLMGFVFFINSLSFAQNIRQVRANYLISVYNRAYAVCFQVALYGNNELYSVQDMAKQKCSRLIEPLDSYMLQNEIENFIDSSCEEVYNLVKDGTIVGHFDEFKNYKINYIIQNIDTIVDWNI